MPAIPCRICGQPVYPGSPGIVRRVEGWAAHFDCVLTKSREDRKRQEAVDRAREGLGRG